MKSGAERVTVKLRDYAEALAARAGIKLLQGQFFAKILTQNDDSGRHGVLIPSDAYDLFPVLTINDPAQNATRVFVGFDALAGQCTELAYKYYQRYPERRITRLNGLINDHSQGKRLQVVLVAKNTKGESVYICDATNEGRDARFEALWMLLTRGAVPAQEGAYVVAPIDFSSLQHDHALTELLTRFDSIKDVWHDSLRAGSTGVGYTLETLLGIKENNDKKADFMGIEIKSKAKKDTSPSTTGKINLFQQAPEWANRLTGMERLQAIGKLDANGLFACYSQVTTKPNNLSLYLQTNAQPAQIDLRKAETQIGWWLHETLEARLLEKHQRAVFVLASERQQTTGKRYRYEELIYCEQPSVERFVDLVERNQLVFEFTMHEKTKGQVRNHGYPWRLNREDLLDQLFAVRLRLRQ